MNVVGVAEFPAVSVLLQVTVVIPNAKVELDTGRHDAGAVGSMLSVAKGDV